GSGRSARFSSDARAGAARASIIASLPARDASRPCGSAGTSTQAWECSNASFASLGWIGASAARTEFLLLFQLRRENMPKTPTVERETATFRLPASLLARARKEGADRGLAYVRSIEEALEIYFL